MSNSGPRWRDDLDESDPVDLVRLIHETTHVDQVRRFADRVEVATDRGPERFDQVVEIEHVHAKTSVDDEDVFVIRHVLN